MRCVRIANFITSESHTGKMQKRHFSLIVGAGGAGMTGSMNDIHVGRNVRRSGLAASSILSLFVPRMHVGINGRVNAFVPTKLA